jgi:hypothetical protein
MDVDINSQGLLRYWLSTCLDNEGNKESMGNLTVASVQTETLNS